MENYFRFSSSFLLSPLIFILCFSVSTAQLSPSETRILLHVQKLLEYPQVLQGWTNWTNFCYLPPSAFLKVVCSDNHHVAELTIVGNRTPTPTQKKNPVNFSVSQQSLSKSFNLDGFFTVLTKLSSLKVLSLVSLGLWGPLPAKINRFKSLEVLNVSSNFIYGQIPQEIVSLKHLTNLVFADNLLNGSVPDLKSLVFLQELHLGGNHLGPSFPSLGASLVRVILSNNSLRSDIPLETIKNLNQLRELDISSNKLLGPITSALFSLPSLQYLDLADNQLSGALPTNLSCSAKLKLVDISHNLLIGKLPLCIASNTRNLTVVSSGNCLSFGDSRSKQEHPQSFCQKQALAVKPPTKNVKHKSTIKLGLILGIIGGVVGIAVVVCLLVIIIVRKSETETAYNSKFDGSFADKMSVRSSSIATIEHRRVPQTMRSAAIGLPPYRMFTLEEVEDATNNFDPMNYMGEESQGQVYKGWLRDGSIVLVKSVKMKHKTLPQSLNMEVLSKLRHLHLASVLGHCVVTYQDNPRTSSTVVFVVLEHVANGTLRDYLADSRKREAMKWPQRMAITIGVARGIQFLHTGVASGLFGNNVKIENVLLDESFTAKLSSYNIPLPSKVGSEGPPNSQDNNKADSRGDAEKEDIYQLGAILLQLITGKLTASPGELLELKMQLSKSLAEGASKLRAMIDPCTRGTVAYESLRNTAEITINCLNKGSSNQPSIEDVLWNLQYSMQIQEGWTTSGNLTMHTL